MNSKWQDEGSYAWQQEFWGLKSLDERAYKIPEALLKIRTGLQEPTIYCKIWESHKSRLHVSRRERITKMQIDALDWYENVSQS